MSNTLFLQFYDKEITSNNISFSLNNGFSDTWALCENLGDIIWYDFNIGQTNYLDESLYYNNDLPLSTGTVYISAVFSYHLFQSYIWAKKYPNINFIVGGPILYEKDTSDYFNKFLFFKINETMPTNLTLTGRSVEETLGVENYSCAWHLELPEEVMPKNTVKFSYTLENQCYWRKCIFCSTTYQNKNHRRSREIMNLDLDNIIQQKNIFIRLNTGSITPYHIENFIPKLPDNDYIKYYIFIRTVRNDLTYLKNTLKNMDTNPNLKFGMGLEFPSQRMWNYIKKGFTLDSLLYFIEICQECKITMCLNFILGWNNLIDQDILDLQNVLNIIPDDIIETVRLWWLFAYQNTYIYENYLGKDTSHLLGPFDFGFSVKLPTDQMNLNQIAGSIIKDRFSYFNTDFSNFTRGII